MMGALFNTTLTGTAGSLRELMFGYPIEMLNVVWPVVMMFLCERIAVVSMLRTKKQCDRVRRNKWLHPNAISLYRLPMGLVSIFIYHLGYIEVAIFFFSFWMITDLTDGDIARRCNLHTVAGETLDPLSDKAMYMPPMVYLSYMGLMSPLLVTLFIISDVVGQLSRFFIKHKAANLFGKAKTFLVVVLLALTMLDQLYGPLPFGKALNPLLALCVALAVCSTAFKVIPNYWYANILSLMNLVCGLAGIVLLVIGEPAIYAFGLVFLGQFLDLFDGRAAERWGSTPKGEIFDDVADGTSFGVTVALIIGYSFNNVWLGLALGLGHAAATIYRLIRFVVEKRKAGIQGGVANFAGMPSPGGALLAGSACLFLDSDIAKAVLVAAETLLMVSRVPYAHFGRSLLPKIPKIVKVITLAAYLVALAWSIRANSYDAPLGAVFAVSVIYLVSPLFGRAGRGAVK